MYLDKSIQHHAGLSVMFQYEEGASILMPFVNGLTDIIKSTTWPYWFASKKGKCRHTFPNGKVNIFLKRKFLYGLYFQLPLMMPPQGLQFLALFIWNHFLLSIIVSLYDVMGHACPGKLPHCDLFRGPCRLRDRRELSRTYSASPGSRHIRNPYGLIAYRHKGSSYKVWARTSHFGISHYPYYILFRVKWKLDTCALWKTVL